MDFRAKRILAPLTKGGNLPFRRLCVDFGAEITVSEMAYAREIKRRNKRERALLRHHPSESCFGVQLAGRQLDETLLAAERAVEAGAKFIDLNCGCPIYETTKRALGAAMMRKPNALAKLVGSLVGELAVPVTVKIRAGWKESSINALEIAQKLVQAGAAAITLHARTREQRYSKAANWDLVRQLVEQCNIPIVGNGDILTHYEHERRLRESSCASIMLGRGALIKPWLFKEIAEQRSWLPNAEQRVEVYMRLVQYLKEHFGSDELGKRRVMQFLPWHFGFFCRYRPLPRTEWEAAALEHPLLQTRLARYESEDPLELLLQDANEDTHAAISEQLWLAETVAEACERLLGLAKLTEFGDLEQREFAVSAG